MSAAPPDDPMAAKLVSWSAHAKDGWSYPLEKTDAEALLCALSAKDARIVELTAALEPFAKAAEGWAEDEPDDSTISSFTDEDGYQVTDITLGNLRRALAASKGVET